MRTASASDPTANGSSTSISGPTRYSPIRSIRRRTAANDIWITRRRPDQVRGIWFSTRPCR
jgi:hypothetical protein